MADISTSGTQKRKDEEKKSRETEKENNKGRKKKNKTKKSSKLVEPEPINKSSNGYPTTDKMAEISTSETQKGKDEDKKSRETEKEKNSGRKKENKTKKSVKFVEPEPINKSSNGYRTRVFSSNRHMYLKKLEKLKRNMYDVIRETKGVWCTDVVALYWNRYGHPPELAGFGFTNILKLLHSMEDRLLISRSEGSGNLWICDAKVPHPPPQIKEPEPKPEPEPVEETPWWDPCPPEPPDRSALEEDALPGIPFASDVFPVDCIQPGETIRNVDLPELDSEYLDLKVFITAFYSPSHLWLRLMGNTFNSAIEAIIVEMMEYYERGEGAPRLLAHAAMKVGLYCAAFHQYWHRALIVRIVDTDHAKVLLVDQGWVVKLSIDAMKPLCRYWAKALPAQAIRARMVGVRPPDGAQLWPLFSCFRFADQTLNHLVIARLLAVDNEERVLEVNLREPSTKQRIKRKLVITEGIDHGTELINAGYAELETRTSLKNGERFSYYYPLFEALESGATPSIRELELLLEQGFEPDDVPSFLKHVPRLEAIQCPTPPHLAADIEDYTCTGASASFDSVTSHPVMLNSVSPVPRDVRPREAKSRNVRSRDTGSRDTGVRDTELRDTACDVPGLYDVKLCNAGSYDLKSRDIRPLSPRRSFSVQLSCVGGRMSLRSPRRSSF